jgi:hypothetical protein
VRLAEAPPVGLARRGAGWGGDPAWFVEARPGELRGAGWEAVSVRRAEAPPVGLAREAGAETAVSQGEASGARAPGAHMPHPGGGTRHPLPRVVGADARKCHAVCRFSANLCRIRAGGMFTGGLCAQTVSGHAARSPVTATPSPAERAGQRAG